MYELDVSAKNIQNLTGINAIVNLKKLNCAINPIATLDINSLLNLEKLTCDRTQITSLDLTSLTNLNDFYCVNTPMTQLNVVGLTNLKKLNIQNNQLGSLDVTGLSTLDLLYVGNNNLTTLNLTGMPLLRDLYLGGNDLVTLDLSGLSGLTSVNAQNNNLTTINISGLDNLINLNISSNQFTTLDLSGAPNLEFLFCLENQLTTLDMSGFPHLRGLTAWTNNLTAVILPDGALMNVALSLSGNNLTEMDLSRVNLTGAEMIDLQNNQLTSIDFKNGIVDSGFIQIEGNPNLAFICADADEVSSLQTVVTAAGYTNCVINSYCSFVPGGDYNTITGMQGFDTNNNGCDSSDTTQPFLKVKIDDGTNEGQTFTNADGVYSFYTQAGDFTVTPEIENPTFFNFSPTVGTVNFPVVDNSIATQNFCITANGIHPDLEVVIAPIIPARPGFEAVFEITYKNKGNQVMSENAGLSFIYNDDVMDLISTDVSLATQIPGALTWDYVNLQPFESRSIAVTFRINPPTDITNPVNINDVLNFTANIQTSIADENLADNTFTFNQTVVGSYDPNDITCIEGTVVSPDEIGEYLHYIINFENTGTDFAENIVVKNTIDLTKFDLASMQILSSSHAVDARVTGNVAEFIFQGIQLGIGGHGNILLKIKTKNTLEVGDSVAQRADIFFDYNFPIDTGNANTVFQTLDVKENNHTNTIAIYPNPTHSILNIKSESTIKSVQLFDVQGRLLQTSLVNETNSVLDISEKSNGIYFLKVTSDNGIKTEKIIKN